MFTIYALVDPRNDTTRYVGMTDNVYSRFKQHIRCEGDNLKKDDWIRELDEYQLMVIMQSLETVDTLEKAREREAYWIHHHLSQGVYLLNQQIIRSFTYDNFLSKIDEIKGIVSEHSEIVEIENGQIIQRVKRTSHKPLSVKQKIQRMLVQHPEATLSFIAKKTKVSRSYVSRIRKELVASQ